MVGFCVLCVLCGKKWGVGGVIICLEILLSMATLIESPSAVQAKQVVINSKMLSLKKFSFGVPVLLYMKKHINVKIGKYSLYIHHVHELSQAVKKFSLTNYECYIIL